VKVSVEVVAVVIKEELIVLSRGIKEKEALLSGMEKSRGEWRRV
jgi:hypothetical protein